MGLLDKLWDDTVAGPRPESGLGRLRRFPPFSIRTDLSKEDETPPVETPPPRVTRSIMIRKPTGTPPESPAGETPPPSPFLGSPRRVEWNRLKRRSTAGIAPGGEGTGAGTESGGRSGYPPFEV